MSLKNDSVDLKTEKQTRMTDQEGDISTTYYQENLSVVSQFSSSVFFEEPGQSTPAGGSTVSLQHDEVEGYDRLEVGGVLNSPANNEAQDTSSLAISSPSVASVTLTSADASFIAPESTLTISPGGVKTSSLQHESPAGSTASAALFTSEPNPGDNGSTGSTDNTGNLAAPLPTYSINAIGDYLKEGFWDYFGGSNYRSFNMGSTGTGANNGTIIYDYTGFNGATVPGAGYDDSNGLTTDRRALTDDALDYIGEVLNINFVHRTTQSNADIDLFFSDNQSGAFANSYLYGSGNGDFNHRYIDHSWVNVSSSWSGGTSDINDYTFQTLIHEIGHAIGLGHAGPYNGNANYVTDTTDPNYGNNSNIYLNDSWQQSIMSYMSQTENTSITASYAFVGTWMAGDWEALRDYYDTSSAFTGNTTYGFNTNIAASTSQFFNELSTQADDMAFMIADSGGIDTVDFSGFSADQTINLQVASGSSTSGSISNIGGLTGNMTLAVGTVIERAKGGSGDDTIYGNDSSNILTGNAGDDTIKGFGGNDTLYGNAGSDTLTGGDGTNYLYGANGVDGSGETGINSLSGNGGNDFLRGGDLGDTLSGGDGDDELRGNAGNDSLDGGDGMDEADYFYATSGVNVNLTTGTATGGDGSDTLVDIESVSGSGHSDTLTSSSGVNGQTLFGQGGNDTLVHDGSTSSGYTRTFDGGSGTDTFDGSALGSSHTVDLAAGKVKYGAADRDNLTSLENVLVTSAHVTGDSVNNVITATGNFANTLSGGAGDDTISGGQGDDTIDGGTGIDTASYTNATGGVNVNLITGTATGADGNDTLSNIERILGSNHADTIISNGSGEYYGNGGDDLIYAGLGTAETLDGGTGVDTLDTTSWNGDYIIDLATGVTNYPPESFTNFENVVTGGGNDHITGTSGANVITTNGGNDTILGLNGVDTIRGGDGNDTIDGGGHVDEIFGEGGDDVILVTGAGWHDNVDGGTGTDTLDMSGITYAGGNIDINLGTGQYTFAGQTQTITNVENAIGSDFNDTIIGDGGANVLNGNGGNDTLNGGGGVDTVNGGAGDDEITDANSGIGDVFDGGAGIDTLIADFTWNNGVTYDLAAGWMRFSGPGGTTYDTILNIENLTAGGAADVSGSSGDNVITITDTGSFHDNTIAGLGGNDTINAGIGNDDVDGGLGNDLINGGAGNDTLTGGGGIDTVNGDAGDDIITDANSGIGDVFDGGAGIDTLIADFTWNIGVTYDLAAGWMRFSGPGGITYDTILNIENLTAGGAADVTGTSGDNVITILDTGPFHTNTIDGAGGNDTIDAGIGDDMIDGGSGDDTIIAGDGNDTILGSAGSDTIDGGLGSDTLSYENAAAAVQVDLLAGTTGGAASGDTISNIENLTGSAFADTLKGGNGDNYLDGGVGADILVGQGGNDSYVLDNVNDIAREGGNPGGIDTVYTYVQTSLRWTIENLTMLGIDDLKGTGNSEDNVMIGNSGNNQLFGKTGDDTMFGGAGNDLMVGGLGQDTFTGGAGNDKYKYTYNNEAGDIFNDFVSGEDFLRVWDTRWGQTGAGVLGADHFNYDFVAQDADDFFIFDTVSNILYFDRDGVGTTHSASLVGDFSANGAILSNTDIIVFA